MSINNVNRLHPLGTINVCAKFHGNPSDISGKWGTSRTNCHPWSQTVAATCCFVFAILLAIANSPLRTTCHLRRWASGLESVGGHTKCGNSTMYLCLFLLPPTTATTLNPSSVSSQTSMFVKFLLCRKS